MSSFKDFCVFNGRPAGSCEYDSFVGVRFVDGKPQVNFPIGYFSNDSDLQESELRQGFNNIIAVLSDRSLTDKNQGSLLDNDFKQNLDFPMQSYMDVLRFFLDFGYYAERIQNYKIGHSGKINWNRTIKTVQPQIGECNGELGVVYLDFVTYHVDYRTDNLISQIHKFCVYDAVQKFGILFGVCSVDESDLDFDYDLFAGALQEKISKSFNDAHLNLFNALLQIVEYLGGHNAKGNGDSKDFTYGVSTFAPVWEAMVERIFGSERREDYYPKCGWVIDGMNKAEVEMRPDTIMQVADSIFVIDSKFYTYGVDGGMLPQSESITKQLAYAEFAEQKTHKTAYNAFIMPYCAEDVDSSLLFKMKYLGYAYSDWKKCDAVIGVIRPYHKIHGILLDVKSVMQNYNKNTIGQTELASLLMSKS